jgi:transcriptional regulator with XRE-family HTH domain
MTGKELKRRRLKAGLTQAQLAYKAGTTVTTISRIETGTSSPQNLTLLAIERVLKRARQ